MEALDKSLDRLIQHESTHDYDRERFEWEKEMERNKMELERKRLDFEIKKMEADEKRAEENRALMLQMVQCFKRPTIYLLWHLPTTILIHHLLPACLLRAWTFHLQSLDPLHRKPIKCTSTMTHQTKTCFSEVLVLLFKLCVLFQAKRI